MTGFWSSHSGLASRERIAFTLNFSIGLNGESSATEEGTGAGLCREDGEGEEDLRGSWPTSERSLDFLASCSSSAAAEVLLRQDQRRGGGGGGLKLEGEGAWLGGGGAR